MIDLMLAMTSMAADAADQTTFVADAANQTGPDFGKASPVGLLIVVLLFIGIVGLVWSMNRHLKRLPDTFDVQGDTEVSAEAVKADGAGKSADESSG